MAFVQCIRLDDFIKALGDLCKHRPESELYEVFNNDGELVYTLSYHEVISVVKARKLCEKAGLNFNKLHLPAYISYFG